MKEQVLVIDFEPRSRDATAGLLREQGYGVVTASSLAELSRFTTASGRVPPFVILEPLLPGTDGFDVCRELKKLRSTDGLPPMVLMGGRVLSGPRYRTLAHQAGADYFFRRPEENRAALARLAEWMTRRISEAVPVGARVPARSVAAPAATGGPAPATPGSTPVSASAESDGEVFRSLPSQPVQPAPPSVNEDEPLPTLVDISPVTSSPRPAAPPRADGPPAPKTSAAPSREPAAAPPDVPAPAAAVPKAASADGAEAVLDEILKKALHRPEGAQDAPEATGESADAAIDALFGDAAPPPAKPVPEKLKGMDEGTAELLSTLEEIEHSVPLDDAPSSGPAAAESESSGAHSETGVSIETSIPLTPPPPREEEESLSAVISDIATPIAEPVEQALSGPLTGAQTGSQSEKAAKSAQTGPRKAPPESRVVPNAAPSRGVPLVAWLAVGAVVIGAALAFWALRPADQTASTEISAAQARDPAATTGMLDPASAGGVPAEPVESVVPPADLPASRERAAADAPEVKAPPPAQAAPARQVTGGAVAPRTETRRPAQATASAPDTRSKTGGAAVETKVPQRRKPSASKPPAAAERASSPPPAATAPAPEAAAPPIEIPAPPAEPVFDEDSAPLPLAAPVEENIVLDDGGLDLEAAPPPERHPLVPGINGVSEPVLLSSSRVEPTFPRAARDMGASGKVILRIVVARDGTVSDIEILSEPGGSYGFGEAARKAVSQWRYRPAVRLGHPVDAYLTVTIQFAKR